MNKFLLSGFLIAAGGCRADIVFLARSQLAVRVPWIDCELRARR
jgi:hypothetical protein